MCTGIGPQDGGILDTTWLQNLYWKSECTYHPLSPIPNLTTCPFIPGSRKPISVANPFDLRRKKGEMMQKANVSQGKTELDKMVRRGELPCVRRSMSLYRERFVGDMLLYRWKGKKWWRSKEEAKNWIEGKSYSFVACLKRSFKSRRASNSNRSWRMTPGFMHLSLRDTQRFHVIHLWLLYCDAILSILLLYIYTTLISAASSLQWQALVFRSVLALFELLPTLPEIHTKSSNK
jgi:hypothetical protein